jgi:DHA2 family multidrug resistance protein
LFNLMRNIGGAVGLALIDTVVENRTAHHAAQIVARLQAGDRATAAFVGLPLEKFHGVPLGPIDDATREAVAPLVNAAAATASFNDAWLMLGAISFIAVLALPLVKPVPAGPHSPPAAVP